MARVTAYVLENSYDFRDCGGLTFPQNVGDYLVTYSVALTLFLSLEMENCDARRRARSADCNLLFLCECSYFNLILCNQF